MKIKTEFNVGEIIGDDLTGKRARIIGISFEHGNTKGNRNRFASKCIGYWVDNDYLGGGRHPWEITKI